MRILKYKTDQTENDVTPKEIFMKRREFMAGAIALGVSTSAYAETATKNDKTPTWVKQKILSSKGTTITAEDKLTPYDDVTSHNNFYEFGTSKSAPKAKSGDFKPSLCSKRDI